MDVSHIWYGSFLKAGLQTDQEMAHGTSRVILYRLHFYCGIYNRPGFKKKKVMPMGLRKFPL